MDTELMGTDPNISIEPVIFLRKKGELSDLLKSLTKASEQAVALLIDTMNDKSVDQKLRVGCAEKLIAFQIATAKEVNQDNMNRMIAQVKINGANGSGSKIPLNGKSSSQDTPALDFSQVKQV